MAVLANETQELQEVCKVTDVRASTLSRLRSREVSCYFWVSASRGHFVRQDHVDGFWWILRNQLLATGGFIVKTRNDEH